MKIKTDFITNSSSVAYIVCIPLWLKLSLDDPKFKEDCEYITEENSLEENIKDANILLEKMKTGGQFSVDEAENTEAFYILRDYLSDDEYCIWMVDIQPDGDSIEVITVEKLNKLFLNVNKDQFDSAFNFLDKEKNV